MNRSQKKDLTSENPFSAEICGSCYYRKSIPAVLHAGRFCDCGKNTWQQLVPPVLLFTLWYAKKHCSICCLKYILLCFADFDLLPAGAPAYNHYENTGRHFQRGL